MAKWTGTCPQCGVEWIRTEEDHRANYKLLSKRKVECEICGHTQEV